MITRNHKPTPLVLTEAQKASLQKPQSRPKHRGLGDLVEKLAKPIAKVIDRVAGTNIQGCGGCQKRKEWMNDHFPQ